jgi:hypothetical protein
MPQASLEALLSAYREQAQWLKAQATAFEDGSRRFVAVTASADVDLSREIAIEYRHKAGNLEAVIAAYERLHAKGT